MPHLSSIAVVFSLSFGIIVVPMTFLAAPVSLEDYPSRPITMMVGTTAGASPDLITRLFAEQLSFSLKVPVVVENRGGANGQIATDAIAKASPDGYSFLSTTGTALTVNPVLQSSTADATLNQLTPITRLVNLDFVITVRQGLQVHTLQELVAWSKKNPGKLNVATTALGSLAYLTAHLFKQTTGIDFVTWRTTAAVRRSVRSSATTRMC